MSANEMPAGPEIDRLVGEAMGWARRPDGTWAGSEQIAARLTDDPHAVFYDGYGYPNWSPSTNIAHAWEVVERMAQTHAVHLSITIGYASVATTPHEPYDDEFRESEKTSADTAPLAICRAALKAVGA